MIKSAHTCMISIDPSKTESLPSGNAQPDCHKTLVVHRMEELEIRHV